MLFPQVTRFKALAVEPTHPLAAYEVLHHVRRVIYLSSEQAETIVFERSNSQFGHAGIQE